MGVTNSGSASYELLAVASSALCLSLLDGIDFLKDLFTVHSSSIPPSPSTSESRDQWKPNETVTACPKPIREPAG